MQTRTMLPWKLEKPILGSIVIISHKFMTQEGGDISLALLEALLDQSWVSDSTAPRSSRGNQKKNRTYFSTVLFLTRSRVF